MHHYRDEYLRDPKAPADHVALFDEAQRAWDLEQTCEFMRQKKGYPDFNQSEPEFLLSCIDRHRDWGVVICLVGGGQEINTGEAGIDEWIASLNRSFPRWHVHLSDRLVDTEFGVGQVLQAIESRDNVHYDPGLHLSVSMRSYRAENVSQLVKQIAVIAFTAAHATDRQLCNAGCQSITNLRTSPNWKNLGFRRSPIPKHRPSPTANSRKSCEPWRKK